MGCGNIGSGGGVRRRQNNELRPGRIKKRDTSTNLIMNGLIITFKVWNVSI